MRVLLRFLLPIMLSSHLSAANVHRNIEYGRAASQALLMDASIPEGKGPFAAVIIVHGGGWIGGHREYSVQPLFEPLSNAGFAWFSISYRLASDLLQFGVAVDDVQTALGFVRQNAAKYNVDPNRIAILGESAGAHLASLAVQRSPKAAAAVVALYPPTDLVSLVRDLTAIPESVRQAIKAAGMEALIHGYLREMSPIEHVTPNLPPFLLIHGTSDTVVPYNQSERMLKKLKAAGIPAELITVEGGGHGLRLWERSARHLTYRQQMIDWLHRHLDQPVPAVASGQLSR
jgi:alpha-L-fucosidase 2